MPKVNTLNPHPNDALLKEVQNAGFQPRGAFWQLVQDLAIARDTMLNRDGSLKPQVNVSGRTEQLQTTLTNVTNSGAFNSLGNVVDTSTDHLTDGTGSPLTGGKRGFQALDVNNRLADSFRALPVDVSGTPTASTTLSNDGISTAITIAANIAQFSAGTVSYNSGSVDPGGFGGPNFVWVADPTFAGGALPYSFSTSAQNQTASKGNVSEGSITTAGGSAKTGGGQTGGTGGRAGGRGYVQP